MALLASGHTAIETGREIVIANSIKKGDDFLLLGVGDFHFARSCHARIYVARSTEPRFPGKCRWSGWRCPFERIGSLVAATLEPMCLQVRNQESSAKVGVFAVTVDVVGAAGGWLLTPRIVLHRPAAVSVGCCA